MGCIWLLNGMHEYYRIDHVWVCLRGIETVSECMYHGNGAQVLSCNSTRNSSWAFTAWTVCLCTVFVFLYLWLYTLIIHTNVLAGHGQWSMARPLGLRSEVKSEDDSHRLRFKVKVRDQGQRTDRHLLSDSARSEPTSDPVKPVLGR